jgi:hypothetical protein
MTAAVWVTGECTGCARPRRLHPDGRVYDHLPPPEERFGPDDTYPCMGSGYPPKGGELTAPQPPPVVKIPSRRRAGLKGDCRVCYRGVGLRADGRIGQHTDPTGLWCDGRGRMPLAAAR